MTRTCMLCGCLCLTGLRIGKRMLCCGCESALLHGRKQPHRELLALYDDIPEAQAAVRRS